MSFQPQFLRPLFQYSLFTGAMICATYASAGYEVECSPSFQINISSSGSCSNLPVLVPSNDTQVNMLLSLHDLGLAKLNAPNYKNNFWVSKFSNVPFQAGVFVSDAKNQIANRRKPLAYNKDFDERCLTLNSGQIAFQDAVNRNTSLSSTEKKTLIALRQPLNQCDLELDFIQVDPAWSKPAQQYASYINASIAFYNTQYSTATKIYSVLSQVEDPWLAETAQYMLIRSSLNATYSSGIGPYGDAVIADMDPALNKQSADYIQAYLKRYPNGQYIASARGLLRRSYWLTGQHDLLINEIVWQIHHPHSSDYNLDMVTLPPEIDRRILDHSDFNVKNLKDPFFLTTYLLKQMRNSDENAARLSWNQLNTFQAYFKNEPELFKYLQAVHLYSVQHKANAALAYLPTKTPQLDQSLALSQAFLKGLILEKSNRAQAQRYWTDMLALAKDDLARGLFETALSQHLAAQQNTEAFIGKNALISQSNLQRYYITEQADDKALQSIVKSKVATADQQRAALYILLLKSLSQQNYALFNQYYSYMPTNAADYKGYQSEKEAFQEQPTFSNFIWQGNTITPSIHCPDIASLSKQLAQTPQNLQLQVCMGEYVRSPKRYDQISFDPSNTIDSALSPKTFSRGEVYKQVIAQNNKGELHAYALYRAVMCYSPSGVNDCQGQDVAKSTRKKWYDQLKATYPDTQWAKSLKYYW